nr:efflux transporter outer membrane subunit [Brucella intermedia]
MMTISLTMRKLLSSAALMSLLAGCVTSEDAPQASMNLPATYHDGKAESAGDVTLRPWWEDFRDPRLNSYVNVGRNANLDVLRAIERIEQARLGVIVAAADGFPVVSGNGNLGLKGEEGSLATSSDTLRTIGAGASTSWLIDLFGQVRSAKASANSSLDAAYAGADVAQLAFLSELTAAYIDMRYYQEALAVSRRTLASRRATLKLIRSSQEAGESTRLDVVQAEGLVNSTLATLPALEKGFRVSAHRIATLLGLPAGSLLKEMEKPNRQPSARFSTKSGIPADLLRNRPDIRRAERELAAAVANIGVAKAQLYPSLKLNGEITASRIFTSAATGNLSPWSFGPSLSVPIFNGGRLKANVEIANSAARGQYLAWRGTVLKSIEEVENALVSYRRTQNEVEAQKRVVRSYQEALKLARAKYEEGATSVLDVLDAERSLGTASLAQAAAIRQLARDYVDLNTAIGGGYAAGR